MKNSLSEPARVLCCQGQNPGLCKGFLDGRVPEQISSRDSSMGEWESHGTYTNLTLLTCFVVRSTSQKCAVVPRRARI